MQGLTSRVRLCQLVQCLFCVLLFLQVIFPQVVNELLLCKSCGFGVVESRRLINVSSPLSIHQRVGRLMGVSDVLLHRFQNPTGHQFNVITVSKANASKSGSRESEYSWFPGYTWTIVICPQCGFHLGWFFESMTEASNRSFFGLVLDHLVHQSFADSILTLPNTQRLRTLEE